jgi:hypothetical protein
MEAFAHLCIRLSMQLMVNRPEGLAHHPLWDNFSIMVSFTKKLINIGCDAVCVFFGLINFLQAIRLGTSWMAFVIGFSLTVILSKFKYFLDYFLHLTMGRIPCACLENIHWLVWCNRRYSHPYLM